MGSEPGIRKPWLRPSDRRLIRLRGCSRAGFLFLSMLCLPATFAADVWAVPYSVTDARGVEVSFDAVPTRVISLLPSLTETICSLDACDRLIGVDRFSDWPDQVRALPVLGGLGDIQVERVYALEPDVVFAAESTRVVDRLESLGLQVIAIEPRSLADSRQAIELIAEVLGRPEAAALLLRGIDEQQRKAAARVTGTWHGASVYFEISAAPYAAGESSFIGELLASIGLANVVPASLGPFPKLNPEFVVRADPDLIMGSRQGVDGMRDRPGWRALHALQGGRFCGFDKARYDVLVRPGPRLGEAAGYLADCVAGLPPPSGE